MNLRRQLCSSVGDSELDHVNESYSSVFRLANNPCRFYDFSDFLLSWSYYMYKAKNWELHSVQDDLVVEGLDQHVQEELVVSAGVHIADRHNYTATIVVDLNLDREAGVSAIPVFEDRIDQGSFVAEFVGVIPLDLFFPLVEWPLQVVNVKVSSLVEHGIYPHLEVGVVLESEDHNTVC